MKRLILLALLAGPLLAQTCTWKRAGRTMYQDCTSSSVGSQVYEAVDAGANDTYVATASPTLAALPTGTASVTILFTGATANTGAATLNLSGLGAKPIYKTADGTTLADNDIRAGIPVLLKWDAGSNSGNGAWYVEGQLGNAPTAVATPAGSSGQVQWNNGAGGMGADAGLAYNSGTSSLGVIGGVVVGQTTTGTGQVSFNGVTSGTTILKGSDVAGAATVTIPATTGTVALTSDLGTAAAATLGTGAGQVPVTGDYEPNDADLTAIAALACTENQIIKRNGAGAWVCATDATAGSPTFDAIGSGTNKSAAMVIDTGASLAATGTGTIVATSASGNAGTATALFANGANCSAGNYPLGVDASGAVEDCTAVPAAGANVTLSNLTSNAVALNTDLKPGSWGAVNLGTSLLPFGTLTITGATSGQGGYALIQGAAADTAARTFTLPAASGTVALTSDITAANPMTQAVENSADNSVSVGVGTSGRAFEKTPFTIDPSTGDSSTPGTVSSGSGGTAAGELELYELGSNGSNFRSWLAPDAITADLQLKHADGLPAGSVMTFPTPTGTVSQYSWTNYAEAATASTIPIRDSSGHLIVAAEAYDATGWDADAGVPQKDAVRDKFETLAPSGVVADAALNAKYKQCVVAVTFTGSEIADGKTSLGYVPVNCSLTDWTIIADATLTAAVDIERVTRASWTGTLSGTSIIGAGTNPPAISGATAAQHADITNDSWTSLALLSDDTVEVILSGVTVGSATKLVLVMRGTK